MQTPILLPHHEICFSLSLAHDHPFSMTCAELLSELALALGANPIGALVTPPDYQNQFQPIQHTLIENDHQ